MPAADETLDAGKAWLLARLERGAHPLDGLDPDAARAHHRRADRARSRAVDRGLGRPRRRVRRACAGGDRRRPRSAICGCRPTGPRSWVAIRCPTTRSSCEQYDARPEFFLNATALEDPPLEAIELPFEGSSETPLLPDAPGERRRAAAGRDGLGRDRHVEGGDARAPGGAAALARVRRAARRHAGRRRVAGARLGRRRAPVDPDLRLARRARRPRRRPLRRDRRLVRRLLGDEARLHPPRPAALRGQLGRRRRTSRSPRSGSSGPATPPRT